MKTKTLTPNPETPAELSCTELLACPFCGGEASHTNVTNDTRIARRFTAICIQGCGASGQWCESRELATKAWNRRFEWPASQEERHRKNTLRLSYQLREMREGLQNIRRCVSGENPVDTVGATSAIDALLKQANTVLSDSCKK